MTEAQWLLEYYALREREKEQIGHITTGVKIFKYTLIKLLGLDLFSQIINGKKSEENGLDNIDFVPLSLIAGRKDLVESAMKQLADAEKVQNAMEDVEFENLSNAIASGDIGDMDPIISPITTDPIKEWNSELNQQQLKALGITITDNVNNANTHIKFDKDELEERKLSNAMEKANIKRELEKELSDEQNKFKSKRITFLDGEE